jgi:predicted phage tail protein
VTVNNSVANTIGINWQAPANDGGSAVTNYLVEYKKTTDSSWTSASVNAPTTTHTLANLTAGDYEIRLSAINAIGTSTPTAITATNVVDPTLPTPPSDTPPTPTSSGSSLVNSPTPSAGNLTDSIDTTENSTANDQIIGIIEQSDPGKIIVTWDPPTDGSPTGYVVE